MTMEPLATDCGPDIPTNGATSWNVGSAAATTAPQLPGSNRRLLQTATWLSDYILLWVSTSAAAFLIAFLFDLTLSPTSFVLSTLTAAGLLMTLEPVWRKPQEQKRKLLTESSRSNGTARMACDAGCLSPMKGYCKTAAQKLRSTKQDSQLVELSCGEKISGAASRKEN